jgi:hypothetical protein
MRPYHSHDLVQPVIDIPVRQPQHIPAKLAHITIPHGIMLLLRVAAVRVPVNFDNQPGGNAGEVRNIAANGVLAAKANLRPIAQPRPEDDLCIRHAAAEFFGKWA